MRKRIIAVVLCVSLFTLHLFVFAYGVNENVKLGDIDNDGVLTLEDARLVLRMSAEIDEPDTALADFDKDGTVTANDARNILLVSLGILPDVSKNGDNIVTTDPDNKYICLVNEQFGVDKKALVAVYTEPESDSNYVLEFKKKSLISSEYSRKPDDLKTVYYIPLKGEIAKTNGNLITGNVNCTGVEGVYVFTLMKKLIIPQNPDIFDLSDK